MIPAPSVRGDALKSIDPLGPPAAVLSPPAYNERPSHKLANRVKNAPDTCADVMEANSPIRRDHVQKARDTGVSRSDAIKVADINIARLNQEPRDAIVANRVAAVR